MVITRAQTHSDLLIFLFKLTDCDSCSISAHAHSTASGYAGRAFMHARMRTIPLPVQSEVLLRMRVGTQNFLDKIQSFLANFKFTHWSGS